MMKKILLGTSAIVGASVLLAAPVWAAEKPKLEMDGYLRFEAWGSDQDIAPNDNSRGVGFQMDDVEIHFRGSAKADNGLEYGFYVELQEGGSDSKVGYDEANVFLSGGWGRLEMGSQDGVHNTWKLGAWSISADKDGAWDGDNGSTMIGGMNSAYVNTDFFGGDDANKISYYTPSFSGFQLAVSYTPDTGDQFNSDFSTDVGTGGIKGTQSNQIGVAGRYVATFNDVGVEANVRYVRGDYEGNGTIEYEDAEAYGGGLKISYAGFSVAGSYQDQGDSGLTTANKDLGHDAGSWWDVGVAYKTGPYGVSVVYMQSEANDGGADDDEVKWLQVGGGYAAAPGLDLYVAYRYIDLDDGGTDDSKDSEANMFLVGTQVSF